MDFSSGLNAAIKHASGGDRGARVRARTHLTTDKILSTASISIPLLLMAIVRFLTNGIFQFDSLKCARPHSYDLDKVSQYYNNQIQNDDQDQIEELGLGIYMQIKKICDPVRKSERDPIYRNIS